MSRRERDRTPDFARPARQGRGRRTAASRMLLCGLGVLLIGGAAALGTSVVASMVTSTPRTATIPVPASTPQEVAPPPLPAQGDAAGDAAGLRHADPVRITLPRVGIDTMLSKVGLNTDGTLKVPPNDHVAGWYSDGPSPGDAGGPPAVIAGHVDSYLGPAVFFNLRQVRPHDKVLVSRADGSTAVFVVYRVAQFDKKKFPAAEVYAPGPRAELRLITCTGTFDYGARSYLSDFVVYAALQQPAPSGTPSSGPTATTSSTPAADRIAR